MEPMLPHAWIDVTTHYSGLEEGTKEYRCSYCGKTVIYKERVSVPPPELGCTVGPQVNAAQAMIHRAQIRGELDAASECYSSIEHILDNYVGTCEGQWYTVGSGLWDCGKSPVGVCVYHKIHDPAHDCCIYCGEPEERK